MINPKMKKFKIAFFGLGSIGKKHAKIIMENYDFELIAYRTRKGQEKNKLEIMEFETYDEIFSQKPDIAFITNPTFLHAETALKCVKNDIALFIEKPISHNLKNLDQLEKEIAKRKIYSYIAYHLRFHPVLINPEQDNS